MTVHIRSISFDPMINIDAEGNIDFPVGKISIYQNDICFAIDMCRALDMRCGARKEQGRLSHAVGGDLSCKKRMPQTGILWRYINI